MHLISGLKPACLLFLVYLANSIYSVTGQELPVQSLRSKFRIRASEIDNINQDSIKEMVSVITAELKINAYLLAEKDKFEIHIGDFSAKKNARSKLLRLKKKHPEFRIVRSDNDKIVFFCLHQRKKKEIPVKIEIKPAETVKKSPSGLLLAESSHGYSFEAWNDEKYLMANTAENEDYLTQQEKEVFYYLNLVRMNPPLFANTYLKKHTGNLHDDYEISLYDELIQLDPLPCLGPNKQCWESAKCHAVSSGQSGYVGHERENCTSYFWGECCQYGPSDPLAIILQLLIDRGVESLGHRRICLGSYDELGVSIQPHTVYGSNAVLDFR